MRGENSQAKQYSKKILRCRVKIQPSNTKSVEKMWGEQFSEPSNAKGQHYKKKKQM